MPLRETQRPMPISPYGASKLIGEHYCANFARHYGVETVALRYFNVYGPRQDPNSQYAAVVARFIQAARTGVPLEIHGDGEQTRDYTYVDNVVEANLLAAQVPGVAGEVFNVACGERISVLDIAAALERLIGRPLPRHHVASRPGDVRDTLADLSRARDRLGYTAKIGFSDGLGRTVAAFASG
jgi:UDP-glucose 4-epimerase